MENQDQGQKQEEEQKTDIKEVKYNIKQLDYVIRDLGNTTKKLDEITKTNEENLVKVIEDLKEENFTLNKLPEKMGIYLKQIIPDISNHIQEKILKDFEVSLELCNKQLLDLSNKIQDANKKVEIYQNEQIKKKLINLVLNLVLLIAIGSGSSYFVSVYLLDKRPPSQVFLRPSGDVNVSNSTVLIEPAGKTNIHDNNKKPRK